MKRRTFGSLLEVLETIVLTLLIFLLIQTFVAQPYQVEQQSMEHTLEPGQLVIVDKLTPHFSDYKRGDIVVFSPPTGVLADGTNEPYIKRVIGLGGDQITVTTDGEVLVNGQQLTEPYIFEGQKTYAPNGTTQTWKVPADDLFVLGDHRENSQDSRSFGPIKKSSVLGRAWIRYWPLDQFGPIPGQPSQAPSAAPGAPSGTSPSVVPAS